MVNKTILSSADKKDLVRRIGEVGQRQKINMKDIYQIEEIVNMIYCKDATNTGYRIRPGPSKIKSRFNPSLTPESA